MNPISTLYHLAFFTSAQKMCGADEKTTTEIKDRCRHVFLSVLVKLIVLDLFMWLQKMVRACSSACFSFFYFSRNHIIIRMMIARCRQISDQWSLCTTLRVCVAINHIWLWWSGRQRNEQWEGGRNREPSRGGVGGMEKATHIHGKMEGKWRSGSITEVIIHGNKTPALSWKTMALQ